MKTQWIFKIAMLSFRGRVGRGVIFASRRAASESILERFVSEMTMGVTFGAPTLVCHFVSFRGGSKYITFSTPFGSLSPAAQ